MVLPLESGFANDELELVTEQDMLGDRLVRRRKRRKDADAFLAELPRSTRGDLVVHIDHGIGKYLGLEPIPVGKSQHDCVMLKYAGGDKLYIPVENIDVLSAATARRERTRPARPARRRGMAEAPRAAEGTDPRDRRASCSGPLPRARLRKAPVLEAEEAGLQPVRRPLSLGGNRRSGPRRSRTCWAIWPSGKPMDRLVCGDVGFGKTEVALRAAFVAAMDGQQVAVVAPTTLLARQHYREFRRALRRLPAQDRAPLAPRSGKGSRRNARGAGQTARWTS